MNVILYICSFTRLFILLFFFVFFCLLSERDAPVYSHSLSRDIYGPTWWVIVDVFDGNLDGGGVGVSSVRGRQSQSIMLPSFVIQISRDFDFSSFGIHRENVVQISGGQRVVQLFHCDTERWELMLFI